MTAHCVLDALRELAEALHDDRAALACAGASNADVHDARRL